VLMTPASHQCVILRDSMLENPVLYLRPGRLTLLKGQIIRCETRKYLTNL